MTCGTSKSGSCSYVQSRAVPYLRGIHQHAKRLILQAENARDPGDIFKFLRANGIGSNLALFYEAWALVLENKGRHQEADQVFTDGINRHVLHRFAWTWQGYIIMGLVSHGVATVALYSTSTAVAISLPQESAAH
jgi:hypothetical protein